MRVIIYYLFYDFCHCFAVGIFANTYSEEVLYISIDFVHFN